MGEGGDDRDSRKLRKKTLLLLLMFRPSELRSSIGIVFIELSLRSDTCNSVFPPPFKPKVDYRKLN